MAGLREGLLSSRVPNVGRCGARLQGAKKSSVRWPLDALGTPLGRRKMEWGTRIRNFLELKTHSGCSSWTRGGGAIGLKLVPEKMSQSRTTQEGITSGII